QLVQVLGTIEGTVSDQERHTIGDLPLGSMIGEDVTEGVRVTANRATTSFTLVGHSADFTLSVFPLASSGGRNLTTLAKTHNDMGQKFYTTRCFYGRNHLFTTFFSFPRLSATLRG